MTSRHRARRSCRFPRRRDACGVRSPRPRANGVRRPLRDEVTSFRHRRTPESRDRRDGCARLFDGPAMRTRASRGTLGLPGRAGVARRPARRRRRARTGPFSAHRVRGHRRCRLSGGCDLRAVHGLRGRDNRHRARIGRHRAVQPGNSARRCQRLSDQADLRRGRCAKPRRARPAPPRTAPRAMERKAGWWDLREPAGAARRRSPRPPPWSRPNAAATSRCSTSTVRSPLSPSLLDVEPGGRTRRPPQHRGPGVAASGNGRTGMRAQRSDRIAVYGYPVERRTAAARAGVGGVRAAGGAPAPVAPGDRRRHGRPGHPPDAARHGRCAHSRRRADAPPARLRRPG